jgi:hypothetical protein
MMKKEEMFKVIEEMDSDRKDCLYIMGDLNDLIRWLEDGYKDCEGKKVALEMMSDRYDKEKVKAEKLLKEIFALREEFDK